MKKRADKQEKMSNLTKSALSGEILFQKWIDTQQCGRNWKSSIEEGDVRYFGHPEVSDTENFNTF